MSLDNQLLYKFSFFLFFALKYLKLLQNPPKNWIASKKNWFWNYQTSYISLRCHRVPVILSFLNGKLLNINSWKLSWFSFSERRELCGNLMEWYWFALFQKNVNTANETCSLVFSQLKRNISDVYFINASLFFLKRCIPHNLFMKF